MVTGPATSCAALGQAGAGRSWGTARPATVACRNSRCATGRPAGWHVRPHCWWARPRGHQRGPEGRPHVVDAFAHPSHPEVSRPDALGQELAEPGVCGRSDDGVRDQFPECCPTRVSRSRTRSCSCVIVARSSRMVACCSTTSACRVAITDGITQQNVQRNPPGTLPSHDPVNGYVDPFGWRHGPLVGDVTGLATASPATGPGWRALGRARQVGRRRPG